MLLMLPFDVQNPRRVRELPLGFPVCSKYIVHRTTARDLSCFGEKLKLADKAWFFVVFVLVFESGTEDLVQPLTLHLLRVSF
jgi:hypothetical protein